MDIVPAVEEATAQDFKNSLEKVTSFATRVHVDFNDGLFQGFQTIKPDDISELPENINFEAHLMVSKPFDYTPKLKELGFKKFIIQWETEDNIRDVIEELMNDDVIIGIAIGPETTVADIEPVMDMVDSITVMTIVPGKQGQILIPENLDKVQKIRESNYFGEVQVDGGINDEDIKNVISFRPDTLIVGSYIIKSSSPQESYDTLQEMAA